MNDDSKEVRKPRIKPDKHAKLCDYCEMSEVKKYERCKHCGQKREK